MTGLELQTSGVGRDRSSNWATTTTQCLTKYGSLHGSCSHCDQIAKLFFHIWSNDINENLTKSKQNRPK